MVTTKLNLTFFLYREIVMTRIVIIRVKKVQEETLKAMSFVRDSFLATFFWVVSIFNSFLKRQITSPMKEWLPTKRNVTAIIRLRTVNIIPNPKITFFTRENLAERKKWEKLICHFASRMDLAVTSSEETIIFLKLIKYEGKSAINHKSVNSLNIKNQAIHLEAHL